MTIAKRQKTESAVGDIPNGPPKGLGGAPTAGAVAKTPVKANVAKLPAAWQGLVSDHNNRREPCDQYIAGLSISVRERLTQVMQMSIDAGGICTL